MGPAIAPALRQSAVKASIACSKHERVPSKKPDPQTHSSPGRKNLNASLRRKWEDAVSLKKGQ
eukprot:2729591-Amphidinium_carterae.1